MKYYYHVEDGRFSFNNELGHLLGEEGQQVMLPQFEGEKHKVYILHVDQNQVKCIGEREYRFPTTPKEHELFKKTLLEEQAYVNEAINNGTFDRRRGYKANKLYQLLFNQLNPS